MRTMASENLVSLLSDYDSLVSRVNELLTGTPVGVEIAELAKKAEKVKKDLYEVAKKEGVTNEPVKHGEMVLTVTRPTDLNSGKLIGDYGATLVAECPTALKVTKTDFAKVRETSEKLKAIDMDRYYVPGTIKATVTDKGGYIKQLEGIVSFMMNTRPECDSETVQNAYRAFIESIYGGKN